MQRIDRNLLPRRYGVNRPELLRRMRQIGKSIVRQGHENHRGIQFHRHILHGWSMPAAGRHYLPFDDSADPERRLRHRSVRRIVVRPCGQGRSVPYPASAGFDRSRNRYRSLCRLPMDGVGNHFLRLPIRLRCGIGQKIIPSTLETPGPEKRLRRFPVFQTNAT